MCNRCCKKGYKDTFSFIDWLIDSPAQTYTRRWRAIRAGCDVRWPHRWCWEPPGWGRSSRRCRSSPCAAGRYAAYAPYDVYTPPGHAALYGSAYEVLLGKEEWEERKRGWVDRKKESERKDTEKEEGQGWRGERKGVENNRYVKSRSNTVDNRGKRSEMEVERKTGSCLNMRIWAVCSSLTYSGDLCIPRTSSMLSIFTGGPLQHWIHTQQKIRTNREYPQ